MTELTRLGTQLGAKPTTFMGMSGLGDLVLTCTDNQSRNRRFGLALGRGSGIQEAMNEIGQVVEGYRNTKEVNTLAKRMKVEMPIVEQVYQVLYEGKAANLAAADLLSRLLWPGIQHVLASHISDKNNQLELVQKEFAQVLQCDWQEVDALIATLENTIAKGRKRKRSITKFEAIRFNGPLTSYFHEDTFQEILIARDYFRKNKPDTGSSAIVFASLLHILHGNRPYALSRRSHPITPFAPTGPTEYRGLIERLRNKVERCRKSTDEVPTAYGQSFYQDVTKTWPDAVTDLDAIITSPPFFDSTRFYSANWMRLWFAGWEAGDFAAKPAKFVDERQKKSFDIYDSIFKQAQERLKVGGLFAVHVGKSTKCDMAAALQQVGERYLHLEDWFSESVEHCESHGIRDKGTVTHHQYLLFKKRF